MPNAIKPKKSVLFAYLIIPVVIFVFSVFVPLVTALVYSFFQWKGGPVKTFNGLTNYITLFKDSTFWPSDIISFWFWYVLSDRLVLHLFLF